MKGYLGLSIIVLAVFAIIVGIAFVAQLSRGKQKTVALGEKFTLAKGESATIASLSVTLEGVFDVPGPADLDHPEEVLGEASYPVALLRFEAGRDVVREEFMEHLMDSRRRSITFHDLTLFLIALRQGVATLQVTKETPYRQAVLAFENIKKGMTQDGVFRMMGEPKEKSEREWHYDFQNLEGYPELAPGVQVFMGGRVEFDENWKVREANLGWIDVTGEAPR